MPSIIQSPRPTALYKAQHINKHAGEPPGDMAFFSLHAAYRATGGIARGDDLCRLLADRSQRKQRSNATLAQLIGTGNVFSFHWSGESWLDSTWEGQASEPDEGDEPDSDATWCRTWVPMFQFDLRDLSVRQPHRQVLAELSDVFSGWTLATWFVEPNCWLHDQRPLDLLTTDLPAVLQAARTDRFVALG